MSRTPGAVYRCLKVAAGLSEVTDALVIAISEERGVITAFRRGKGVPQAAKEQLLALIHEHWQNNGAFLTPVSKGRRFYQWAEIAASFLIASAVWYSVVIGEAEIHEKVVTIPIEYIATPKDYSLIGEKPFEIKVHLLGPKSNLLETGNFRAKIDLSKAQPGKHRVTITADNINLGKRVKLLDTQPSSLSLELVQMVEKDIVVTPQLIGKLQNALRIVSVEVIPGKIRALVRSSHVIKGDLMLTTTPVYLENIKSSTTIYGKIVASPRIQPVDKKWPDVEVQIKIDKKRTPKMGQ
ncbi:MAG: DNA integrity scanning protein DisA nucleotide-binding domain protein [SAR324 cluster bacterium]|nr:DNA integrity scanning protein DisA nucleotide-binding domain protein [SAR324 cluster bacterium]